MEETLHKAHELAVRFNRTVDGQPDEYSLSPTSTREAYLDLEPADGDSLSYLARKIRKELARQAKRIREVTKLAWEALRKLSSATETMDTLIHELAVLRFGMPENEQSPRADATTLLEDLEELERKQDANEEMKNESEDEDELIHTRRAETVWMAGHQEPAAERVHARSCSTIFRGKAVTLIAGLRPRKVVRIRTAVLTTVTKGLSWWLWAMEMAWK